MHMFVIETVTHICIMYDNSVYVYFSSINLCIIHVMIVDGEVM